MANAIPADKAGKFDLMQTHLTSLDGIQKQIDAIMQSVASQLSALHLQRADLQKKIEEISKAQ